MKSLNKLLILLTLALAVGCAGKTTPRRGGNARSRVEGGRGECVDRHPPG